MRCALILFWDEEGVLYSEVTEILQEYRNGPRVSWARTYTCEMICSSSELFLFFAGSMIAKLSPCSTHIRIMLCLIVYVWNNAPASLYRFGTMHLNEQSVYIRLEQCVYISLCLLDSWHAATQDSMNWWHIKSTAASSKPTRQKHTMEHRKLE